MRQTTFKLCDPNGSFNGKLTLDPSASRKHYRLPPIRQTRELRTEPSELKMGAAGVKHSKTESVSEFREDRSASYRQLSRFIFNHLQKKLDF
jgi:hypothetical protein